MKKLFTPRKLLVIILLLLVAFGVGTYIHRHNQNTSLAKADHPEYVNFAGNYVFSVPKTFSVDEQAIPGAQLVYSGALSAKTLDELYNASGISVQQITDLADHSSKAFKSYANGSFLDSLKKNLSVNDIKLKFAKIGGWDVAKAKITKNGQPFRFIFLKNGQHPVVVVTKDETDTIKKIELSLTDVENSDLKDEASSIKQFIASTVALIKDQKAQELYSGAAPELRSKNSQADVTNALKSAASHANDNVFISGVTFNPNEFAAGLRYVPPGNNNPTPSFGTLASKKLDGQWKLVQLTLPPAS